MLRSVHDLTRMTIGAQDGEIGRVVDVYFTDDDRTLRYLVADTGKWLSGRQVLITPISVRGVEPEQHRIDVSLSREQIENSPSIDTAKPVSRQHETAIYTYYGYPYYWSGPQAWGTVAVPREVATALADDTVRRELKRQEVQEREGQDPHLRSAGTLTGYHVEATDGPIGHVQDFLYDEDTWCMRFVIVNTRNWLPGRHVIIPIEWMSRASWTERKVYVDCTRETVRNSPEYDPDHVSSRSGATEQYPYRSPASEETSRPDRTR